LKFHQNKKTYPELIFEIAAIDYQQDEYLFFLAPKMKVLPQSLPERRA